MRCVHDSQCTMQCLRYLLRLFHYTTTSVSSRRGGLLRWTSEYIRCVFQLAENISVAPRSSLLDAILTIRLNNRSCSNTCICEIEFFFRKLLRTESIWRFVCFEVVIFICGIDVFDLKRMGRWTRAYKFSGLSCLAIHRFGCSLLLVIINLQSRGHCLKRWFNRLLRLEKLCKSMVFQCHLNFARCTFDFHR